jgi:hypothetical protein
MTVGCGLTFCVAGALSSSGDEVGLTRKPMKLVSQEVVVSGLAVEPAEWHQS